MEMLGTLQGIIHGVYWGLGSGTGSMIGGILVEELGAKNTFWVFAGVSGFNLITFSIVQIVSYSSKLSIPCEDLFISSFKSKKLLVKYVFVCPLLVSNNM